MAELVVSKLRSTTSGQGYEIVDAEARKELNGYATKHLPTPDSFLEGRTMHYLGPTEYKLTHGYFYTCKLIQGPSQITTIVTQYMGFSDTPKIEFDPKVFITALLGMSDVSLLQSSITFTVNASDLSKVYVSFQCDYNNQYVEKKSAPIEVSDINNLTYEVNEGILKPYGINLISSSSVFSYLTFTWEEVPGASYYDWVQTNVQPGTSHQVEYYRLELLKSNWSGGKQEVYHAEIKKDDTIVNVYPTNIDYKTMVSFWAKWGVIAYIERDGYVTFECTPEARVSSDCTVYLTVLKNEVL